MSKFVLTAQLQLQAPNNVAQVVSQIQNQLNNVSVNVQVQGSARANQQLQQITQSTQAATTAAGRMGNAFAVSIRRFAAFSIATRAVGLFTSTLSDAVKTAIDFERELIKISQVTGRSVSSLRDLTDSVTNLSTGLGVTSQSLLEVTTVLTQAGLSSDDTKIALESLAKAALAPNFDSISETAEGAIAILAQFKQGVGALEGQLSSIDAVAGAFAVEAGDLIDVIRRSGGVFKASGGSLNELLALFTSVRATTRESAESIGTGLRTIFTRIQRPETIEFLKQFGVELVDLNGKFVGPYEAIRRLSEAISGLGEGDLTFIKIAEELGGFRQIGKVLPLLQQFSTAQAALNVAQNAGNGLTKNAETAQASLAIRIIKVKEEFLALVRSMTETTTFQVMANTALALASALIKIADSIKPLLPLLGAVAAFKAVKGIGGFLGGVGAGLTSGRTFSTGGKVHAFATGGLVPGTGNRDTVPAMLTPGEFVIRKSSVQKLGAGNLAHMNTGGIVQKFAGGGLIDKISSGKKEVGAALLENKGVVQGSFSILKPEIEKRSGLKLNSKFPTLGQFNAPREGLSNTTSKTFNESLDNAIVGAANQAAASVASDLGLATKQIDASTKDSFLKSINTGTRGNLFEDTLSVLKGGPFAGEPGRPFDFPTGLSGVLKDDYKNLPDKFIDAKASLSAAAITGTGSLQEKTIRQIINELKLPENLQLYTNNVAQKGKEDFIRGRRYSLSELGMTKAAALQAGFETRGTTGQYILNRNLGGIIQKFAVGGLAKPKDTLERYFTDASPINLGLSNSKSLSKDQRKQLASDTRDLRQLRTTAPTELYSSISRNAFDKFAMDTGLNKNPEIPAGTKLFERSKFYAKEVANIIGKSFSLPGFVSTSKNYGVAKSFLDNAPRSEDNWAAMLTIATKKNAQGVDVAEQLKDRKINVTKQDINPRTGKMDTFFMKQPSEESEVMLSPRSKFRINTAKYVDLMGRHNLWANVQQFANGGRAKGIQDAPLVDDILQASGSILPRPSAAIQALIKAGGGAVDVDRTLKRTIGDTAYAKAPTPGAKDASLNNYFRDEVKRLQDLKSAPITQFGQELQAAIKSGQLDARKISIISKSKRVKGAAEYLSSQFGIPVQNMIFTQGASKQPALDAIRNKGSRVDRVARFATGGNVGTDTVPALLTPGEFVVTKSAAQRIGYGNLHRMNKVGKYAKGGIVQHFAQGSGPTGVKSPTVVSNIPVPGFDTKAPTLLNKVIAQLTGTFSIVDIDLKKSSKQFKLLQTITPDLAKSLMDYAQASNLNVKQTGQLASAYSKLVGTMLMQGDKDSQIVASMQPYVDALKADTDAKLASAKATAASTANTKSSSAPQQPAPQTQVSGSLNAFNAAFQTNTQAVQQNTSSQQQCASTAATVANNNKMFAASMAVSLLQGFLPAVDENSSMLLKFSTSVLGIVSTLTTVGFALEAFGVSLSLQELTSLDKMANRLGLVFDSIGNMGTGLIDTFRNMTSASAASAAADTSEAAASAAATVTDTAEAAASTAAVASDLGKGLGVLAIGATVGYLAVKTFSDALRKSAEDMNKKKIEAGDVEGARQAGQDLGSVDFAEMLQTYGAIAGGYAGGALAATGSVAASPITLGVSAAAAPITTAAGVAGGAIAGGAIGRGAGNFINATFGPGDAAKAMGSVSASAAQFVQTNKVLENSSDKAAKALENVQAGTISLRDALDSLAVETQSSVDAMKLAKEANAAEEKVVNKQTTGFGRTLGAYATFGYVDSNEDVQARKNNMMQRTQDAQRVGQQQLRTLQPAMQQQMTETASSGGDFDDFISSLSEAEFELLNLTDGAMRNAASSFENISKEIQRAQKAFSAMNLGMQNVQGAAAAAALGVSNYVASQQAGNIRLEQSLAVLEASVTSAAQGISDADFGNALSDASEVLYEFGANPEQVTKFQRNISSVNEVQKNQSSIFGGARDKLAENIRNSGSAKGRQEAFTKAIEDQLKASGYDDATIKRFKEASANMSDDQLQKIGTGDFTAFEESINELGKKTMEQVSGPLKAAIEIQKQLNDLTKQRIEVERQLMSAQLEASNVRMEAMDIAAKYGGPKVTPAMRAQNTVEQANIQARGIKGVTDLKTGSAQELSARTEQMSARQSEISNIKLRAAQGDAEAQKQLEGQSGTELKAEEEKLQAAAKSQIQITRDLIKSKEEELKIIKEKNQLERSSIDALVSGDIEKFFDQQAAIGAQAAVATGDQRMIRQFGMGALGDAAKETRRQQDAGVTSIYGQNLAGPGGLTERTYGSALSTAGIQNPLAMAQVAAGSTGAETALESEIRDLAATMGPTADIQVQAADGQLLAAKMQLDAARSKGEEAVVQMQARANGGLIYASRGIFVPRGTDTVPAMLTPGEFVVRREAVQRNNNLSILQAINRGVSPSAPASSSQSGDVAAMATGGIVRYRSGGSTGPESGGVGISVEALNAFSAALSQFNTELTKNIKTLADTKFNITLSPTNINVNLTGTSFLANLTATIKQDLLKFLGQEITNYSVGNDGKLRKTGSTLGTVT